MQESARVGLQPVRGTAPSTSPEGHGRRLAKRVDKWTGRAVTALAVMRPALAAALIAGAIGAGWLGLYLAGGASHAPPHWFYLPILVAAARFGVAGALVTAGVSGVVAGPLLPADVALGTSQLASDELIRTISFAVIGTLMAAIIRRLEESLSNEAELARQQAELVRHKDAVIATVSHEFRTPLSVLLGSSKMLLAQAELPELGRTMLEGIASSARRLNDLVTTVLAVSEGPLAAEDLVATRASLRQVISSVVTGTDPRDTARLQVDLADAWVWTNPGVLEALLRQLLDNALKFSPTTSRVRISVRPAQDLIEVVITDRGPGIDEGFLPKAFDAFTQHDASLTRSNPGLGIGLFVAQRLAEYLGCTLRIRALPGGGTEAAVGVRRAASPPAPGSDAAIAEELENQP